jgi:hypothetical protein
MLPCHAFTNFLQTAPAVEGRTPSSRTLDCRAGNDVRRTDAQGPATAGQRVLDHTRGNLKAVQKLLGYSSTSTTADIYTD